MSKYNDNIKDIITPLISELMKKPDLDKVKTDIIKEEIKNNSYHINTVNIAKKILKLSEKSVQEITVE